MATVLTRRFSNSALPVCVAAMDGCWIYLVTWLFSAYVLAKLGTLPVPSPLVLAVVELAALWTASKLVANRSLPDWAIQAISGAAGLLVSLAVAVLANPPGGGGFSVQWLGTAAYGIVICLVLWFIGNSRAADRADFNQAYTMFRIGLAAIGVSAVLTALFAREHSNDVWAGLGGVALWFFAWSLAALALGNREVVRQETGNTGMGPWTIVLLGSIAAILLVGSAGGAFGAGGILDIGQKIVAGLLLAVGAAVYALFFVVLGVASLFNSDIKPEKPPIPTPEDAQRIIGRWNVPGKQNDNPLQGMGLSPEWYNVLTWVTLALLAILAIWIVTRSLRRARRMQVGGALEEREQLGSWALLRKQVSAWISRLLGRFRPAQPSVAGARMDDLADLQGRPEWSGTLSVRQIYARLQRMAASVGYPRHPEQTPLEYLKVLQRVMPQHRQDFAAITAAYIEARYGPLPASGPAVRSAQEAWKRTEPALQAAASSPPVVRR